MTKPKNPAELNRAINDYFASREAVRLDKNGAAMRDEDGRLLTEQLPYTVTGLAYALGLTSRDQLYSFKNPKMRQLIDRALLKIEAFGEEKLFSRESFSGTRLFLSKNFSRWDDSAETDDFGEEDMEMLARWGK